MFEDFKVGLRRMLKIFYGGASMEGNKGSMTQVNNPES
jgi:hypothetical protein